MRLRGLLMYLKNRISRPKDWKETTPGTWEIKGRGHTVHLHGDVQCRICGAPFDRIQAPNSKLCTACGHALARYKGYLISKKKSKMDKRLVKRIEEFLMES